MDWDIPVSLFISVVFGHIVKVISSDDDGPLHFGGDHDALQDLAPDGDTAGEGAFLIDVLGFDGLFRRLEPEADVLKVSNSRGGFLGQKFLAVEEDAFLLLEGSLVLRIKEDVLDCQPCFATTNYY